MLLTTDRNLNVVGDPIVCWSKVTAIRRFNSVSSATADLPAYPWLLDQLEPGNRMVLIRDRAVFVGGPIVRRQFKRSATGEASGTGTVGVTWADDFAWVAARSTYPNPAEPADGQTADRWDYNGNAELAMHAMVNLNAGPGALLARRVPGLILADLNGVGSDIVVSTRFEPLADALRSAALAGGGLGIRTVQPMTDNVIRAEVYQPRDLTNEVRFSFGLGNLLDVDFTSSAPTATVAHVGGQGEGAAREISEYIDADAVAAWGRMERFVDQRDTSDPDALDQSGDEALAEGGESAQLTTITIDTPTQRYGEHYDLGDRVAVAVWPGRQVSDVVRAVQLDADASTGAETVTATVGTQEASSDRQWVALVRNLDRRMRRLEVR